MRKIWLWLPFLFTACSQRELPQQQTRDSEITIEKHLIPEVVNPGREYVISVRVIGETDRDSLRLNVLTATGVSLDTVWLFDDGGALHHDDGDQVAFDGYFSCRFLWSSSIIDEQHFIWRFETENFAGQTTAFLEIPISSKRNFAPHLLQVSGPDTLRSAFEGVIKFQAMVDDSNGVGDINRVLCTAQQKESAAFLLELSPEPQPGLYSISLNSQFAIAKKGSYDLFFKALDKSGVESNVVSRSFFIENKPPVLSEFSHADSVQRPPTDKIVAFLITVRVIDDQSIADIKSVKLEWKKPDGTYSKNSPFDLFDNGLPWNDNFDGWDDGWRGDEKAGDGIYSITGIFDPLQPLGDYLLTFYAEDFSGNRNDSITRVVTLYDAAEGN
ncbi:MAG: hypothetical protein EHM72_13385 [Calditrichaeota bacterium]|nr:MAG: hypothetical protein EHM72_13385 [Calditrichota bacterium]